MHAPKTLLMMAGMSTSCVEYSFDTPHDVNVGPEEVVDACDHDQSPEIIQTHPEASAVLTVEEDVLLEAWIIDEHADLAATMVQWFDQQGDLIDEQRANTEGLATGSWPAERDAGDQMFRIEAHDECGNTTQTEVWVCQQGGYSVESLELSNWHLEGSAEMVEDNEIELTGLDTWQIGSAFMIGETVQAGDVHIEFEFLTEGGTGADGISLTALDADRMTGYLGGHGCGIGYGGGVDCTDGPALPGWSIELDTWYNAELPDPTLYDHAAFTFDGDVAEPQAWGIVPELEDTGWHTIEITVAEPQVTVRVDGVIYLDATVDGNFDFPAYIGFTGSTGGETNRHRIRALTVTENFCPVDDIEKPTDDSGDVDTGGNPDIQHESQVSSDWGDGYCTEVRVWNEGAAPVIWDVTIPMDGTITSLWDATSTDNGSDWVFTGADWNTALEPGMETTFGFCAER